MTPEEMGKKARELFEKRMHCSQAVLAVGLEKMDLDEPAVIRALGAMGGGIASTGRTCGCLTGGVAAISRVYAKSNPSEQDDPAMWRLSYKLSKRFDQLTEEYGGADCAAIARVKWNDRDDVKDFYGRAQSRRLTICAPLVEETAKALGELLESQEKKS